MQSTTFGTDDCIAPASTLHCYSAIDSVIYHFTPTTARDSCNQSDVMATFLKVSAVQIDHKCCSESQQ